MAPGDAKRVFGDYFAIFPWEQLPPNAEGFDMGCGSGRWARFVAPHVGRLHCIHPSSALAVACQALADQPNVQFHQASVANTGLPLSSQDFGYSLGVLHHVPDTAAAIRSCAELLKPARRCCSICITRSITVPAGSACSGAFPMPPAC